MPWGSYRRDNLLGGSSRLEGGIHYRKILGGLFFWRYNSWLNGIGLSAQDLYEGTKRISCVWIPAEKKLVREESLRNALYVGCCFARAFILNGDSKKDVTMVIFGGDPEKVERNPKEVLQIPNGGLESILKENENMQKIQEAHTIVFGSELTDETRAVYQMEGVWIKNYSSVLPDESTLHTLQQFFGKDGSELDKFLGCLLYTSPSPRDRG